MIQRFLSNKYNLIGLYTLTGVIIIFLFETAGMTFAQMFLAYLVIYMSQFISYLYGMSRGVMQTTMKRPDFIKELDKINELLTNDDKMNEIKNNSQRDSNCGKCNRNDGTCGCGKVKNCTLDKCVHPTCNTDETSK